MLECGKNSTTMSIHLLVLFQLHHLHHPLGNCLGGAVDLLEIEAQWSQECLRILLWREHPELETSSLQMHGPKVLAKLCHLHELTHTIKDESWTFWVDWHIQLRVGLLFLQECDCWRESTVNSQQVRCRVWSSILSVITLMSKFQFVALSKQHLLLWSAQMYENEYAETEFHTYIHVTILNIRGFVLFCAILARKGSDKIINKPSTLFCFVRQKSRKHRSKLLAAVGIIAKAVNCPLLLVLYY